MIEIIMMGGPIHAYADKVLQDLSAAEKVWGLV